ncbi:hypothetical protein Scep_030928 [Stephania cephalantha]|uniref:MADS-box domain-containing protein n=1 Tax=Stephania cephalantha TaxID=152367 RepID=A0AAP0E404_9MAGN
MYSSPQQMLHTRTMARKKVKLAWIANESARKATFKKRKMGLMKKVSELSTLCDVPACAIVFGPNEEHPEVWPRSQSEVDRVVMKFRSLPGAEQSKKMVNQEAFLKDRNIKLREQLKKAEKENREFEMTLILMAALAGERGIGELGVEQLSDLAWFVDDKMKVIHGRMDRLMRTNKLVKRTTESPSTSSTSNTASSGAAEPHHYRQYSDETISYGKLLLGVGSGHLCHHLDNKTPIDMAMETLKRQSWFMENATPQEHIPYDHITMPYGDWPPNFYS